MSYTWNWTKFESDLVHFLNSHLRKKCITCTFEFEFLFDHVFNLVIIHKNHYFSEDFKLNCKQTLDIIMYVPKHFYQNDLIQHVILDKILLILFKKNISLENNFLSQLFHKKSSRISKNIIKNIPNLLTIWIQKL